MTASNHVFDNLSPVAVSFLRSHLSKHACSSGLEDVFWMPIPDAFLTDTQKEHVTQCGPYVLALVLEDSSLSLEFLVRASNALHCSCIGQASPELRTFAINQLDAILALVKA